MTTIAVVVTARASFARVQTVIEGLMQRGANVELILAGSATLPKFGRVAEDPWFADGKVHRLLDLGAARSRAAVWLHVHELAAAEPISEVGASHFVAQLIGELTTFLTTVPPVDTLVVVADRYETVAASLVAAHLKIRLVHLLGGEQSGNIDNKMRDVNTALADLHFTATHRARKRVARICRDESARIFNFGCPSVDLALRAPSPDPAVLKAHGVGFDFEPDEPYVVGLYHPTPADPPSTVEALFNATVEVARERNLSVLWFWPNIDPGQHEIARFLRHKHEAGLVPVRFYRNLPPETFLGLVRGARALVGNSSIGVREAAVLGTPVVNVGRRQFGREVAENVLTCGTEAAHLASVIRAAANSLPYPPSFLYGDGSAGERIAERILDHE